MPEKWYYIKECPFRDDCSKGSWDRAKVRSKDPDKVIKLCIAHLRNSGHHNMPKDDAVDLVDSMAGNDDIEFMQTHECTTEEEEEEDKSVSHVRHNGKKGKDKGPKGKGGKGDKGSKGKGGTAEQAVADAAQQIASSVFQALQPLGGAPLGGRGATPTQQLALDIPVAKRLRITGSPPDILEGVCDAIERCSNAAGSAQRLLQNAANAFGDEKAHMDSCLNTIKRSLGRT
jgi:hypothetical protein